MDRVNFIRLHWKRKKFSLKLISATARPVRQIWEALKEYRSARLRSVAGGLPTTSPFPQEKKLARRV